MPLEIIPAIDLRGGKAVRLQRGEFGSEMRVAEDPVKAAEKFASEGASRLHVVDLDGARTGDPQNLVVIREIIKRVPNLLVQVGGGIRTAARAEQVFNIGAARIIVGTTAASGDPSVIAEMLVRYGDRIIVGADMKDGYVAVQGWMSASTERVEDFGQRLAGLGASRFLFTDVSRDGMLEGVNVEATASFARTVGRPTLASGGVAGPQDIKNLTLVQPQGVEGVIIGKALYSGALTAFDAIQIAADGEARLRAPVAPPPGSTGPLPDWLRE